MKSSAEKIAMKSYEDIFQPTDPEGQQVITNGRTKTTMLIKARSRSCLPFALQMPVTNEDPLNGKAKASLLDDCLAGILLWRKSSIRLEQPGEIFRVIESAHPRNIPNRISCVLLLH
jgi:hypothetical protein